MFVSQVIELQPNRRQATLFAKAVGIARFAYNWALAQWQAKYKAGGTPSAFALSKQLNEIKAQEFAWMLEVPKRVPQQAILNLGNAFKRFFKGESKYPRFKKKGVRDRCRFDNGPPKKGENAVKVKDRKIKLPRIGWVRMRETVRFQGQIKSAIVSRQADRWFVSLAIDTEAFVKVRKSHGTVGVDLGIKTLAMLSNGEAWQGPRPLKRLLKKLARLQRDLSRKKKGSNNREKAKLKVAKLHARIANIRRDSLHKLTTSLVQRFSLIGIEDLNVRGMMANHRLARSIADMGFYEFRRQLEYKATWYASQVVAIGRFEPSSKKCSHCGAVKQELSLSVRTYKCNECGIELDRDLNAARNIENLAVSSTVPACGEEGAGLVGSDQVKPASVKQEENSEPMSV